MSISLSQLNADMGFMIDDLPTIMTFAGITYSGVFTDFDNTNELNEGGYISEFAASFHAQQSDFTTMPSTGITVGIATKVFRVAKVMKSPDDVEIRIDLITPDK